MTTNPSRRIAAKASCEAWICCTSRSCSTTALLLPPWSALPQKTTDLSPRSAANASEDTAVPASCKLDLVHMHGEHVSTFQLCFCDSLCSVKHLSRRIQQPSSTRGQGTLGTLHQQLNGCIRLYFQRRTLATQQMHIHENRRVKGYSAPRTSLQQDPEQRLRIEAMVLLVLLSRGLWQGAQEF
eukprot:s1370_g7.t1